MHKNIHKYIYELSSVPLNIFTNFTIKNSVKNLFLQNNDIGFLVNLNNRDLYNDNQWKFLIENLDEAATKSFTFVLGFNVYKSDYDFSEIIRLSKYYKCKRMRVSIANPCINKKNICLPLNEIRKTVNCFRELYYELNKFGIRLDIDCPIAPCFCDYEDYKFLYDKGLIRNQCASMLFIHYDLSIGNCYATDGLLAKNNLREFRIYEEAMSKADSLFSDVVRLTNRYGKCFECDNIYKADNLCGCIRMYYRFNEEDVNFK